MDSGDTSLDTGTTPLMRAARAGDATVMRLLIAKGADPKLATKEGNTALMFAAGIGHRRNRGSESEALEALKVSPQAWTSDAGTLIGVGTPCTEPLPRCGYHRLVQFLADHGSDPTPKPDRIHAVADRPGQGQCCRSFRSLTTARSNSCENSAVTKATPAKGWRQGVSAHEFRDESLNHLITVH